MLPQSWFERPGSSSGEESNFRTFADKLPVMIYLHDAGGAVSFANEMWHRTLGMPQDLSALTLDSWRSVIHADDIDAALAAVSDAIANGGSYSLEYRLKARDADASRYRWYLARGAPHFSEDGACLGWIGSIVDIHDARLREDTERALREIASRSEREFRVLADIVPVMMWMADALGNIQWYNRRWYDYTGQSEDDALGWGWQAVHHPDDLPRVMEMWPHSLATGETFEMEFRIRRADGSFHMMLTRAVPVRDERGEIVRWYGTNVDVQAQRDELERTQRVANTLQRVFLPERLPHTPKMRVDAVYHAAESDGLVGGDWLDAVELPDGRYLFSIGDVTGHGLDASVIAGRLRHAIVDFSLECADPAQVLARVNSVLRLERPDTYATALVAFVDDECSQFTFSSAGHPPPVLAGPLSEAQFLSYGGLPLGLERTLSLSAHTIDIEPDSVLALYTDGITEVDRNLDAAERRLKRAVSAMVNNISMPSPAEYVRNAVVGYRHTIDDTALLVLQFSAIAVARSGNDRSRQRKVWRFHSSDAYSARVARQELMRFVRRQTSDADSVFATELIIGELLANTVEHAPGLVEIEIDWSRQEPTLSVIDSGPGLSALPHDLPHDKLSEGGRGLFLIRSLAKELRISPVGTIGTQVLVKLPTPKLRGEHLRLARPEPRR